MQWSKSYARSSGVGLDGISLSIASEGVTGGVDGIDARNYGTGALSIVANGDAEGTADVGIFASQNNGSLPGSAYTSARFMFTDPKTITLAPGYS